MPSRRPWSWDRQGNTAPMLRLHGESWQCRSAAVPQCRSARSFIPWSTHRCCRSSPGWPWHPPRNSHLPCEELRFSSDLAPNSLQGVGWIILVVFSHHVFFEEIVKSQFLMVNSWVSQVRSAFLVVQMIIFDHWKCQVWFPHGHGLQLLFRDAQRSRHEVWWRWGHGWGDMAFLAASGSYGSYVEKMILWLKQDKQRPTTGESCCLFRPIIGPIGPEGYS